MLKTSKNIFLFLLFLGFLPTQAQTSQNPFSADIRRFQQLDFANPPKPNSIVFYGSSSFTLWTDVQEYFPDFPIINRGFGGSCLTDLILFADQIVFPYQPRQIVIYCGENDFASNDTLSAGAVTNRFIQLFRLIRTKLPEVQITYISMKPSPYRWPLAAKFTEANHDIEEFLKEQSNTTYIDIWDKMLNKNSLPDSTLFLEDMLHMKAEGYKLWQQEIAPHLTK
ncbi:MAG: GDSL-type esterase/lipase family protein [Bacteroidales bacterium]